jgi:membrane associated rhomboid family serine protease
MPTLGPVTRAILATWVAIWVLSFLTALAGPGLAAWLALDAVALFHGNLLAFPGILTHALAHDPYGILHLLFNALAFFWLAPELELLWPGRRFLIFLATAALAGAGLHLLLAALFPVAFAGIALGGSGLVSAVLAAHAAVYPDRQLSLIFFRCRLIHFFLVLLLLDLLWFIADLAGRHSGIAHEIHLAGSAVGWLYAGGCWRRGGLPALATRGPLARWGSWRAARAARRAAAEEAELDRILAKIGREGMPALTAAERAFLERRSRHSRK